MLWPVDGVLLTLTGGKACFNEVHLMNGEFRVGGCFVITVTDNGKSFKTQN